MSPWPVWLRGKPETTASGQGPPKRPVVPAHRAHVERGHLRAPGRHGVDVRRPDDGIARDPEVAVALVVGDDQDHVGPGVLSLCVRRGGYARDNDRPGQDCAR